MEAGTLFSSSALFGVTSVEKSLVEICEAVEATNILSILQPYGFMVDCSL